MQPPCSPARCAGRPSPDRPFPAPAVLCKASPAAVESDGSWRGKSTTPRALLKLLNLLTEGGLGDMLFRSAARCICSSSATTTKWRRNARKDMVGLLLQIDKKKLINKAQMMQLITISLRRLAHRYAKENIADRTDLGSARHHRAAATALDNQYLETDHRLTLTPSWPVFIAISARAAPVKRPTRIGPAMMFNNDKGLSTLRAHSWCGTCTPALQQAALLLGCEASQLALESG